MSARSQEYHQPSDVKYQTDRPVLLDCPSCHSFISANQINLDQKTAACGHCKHTFDFESKLKKDPHRRPEIFIPDGVEMLKISSLLDIEVDWYKSAPKKRVGSIVGSSFLWNIFLIPVFFFFLLSGDFIFLFFFVGHLITGLGLLWYLLALFLNKTRIEVNQKGINIKHSPIPTFRNRSFYIPITKIKQLYVTRYTEKIKGKKTKGMQAYALSAVLHNGKVIELLKGMDRKTQLYIEQEIEQYLGIEDQPIQGETLRLE